MATKKPDSKSGVNTVVTDTMPEKPVKGASASPTVSPKTEVQKTPAPKEKEEEKVKLPAVRLDVFLATQFKPDQAAGFAYWAKKQKLGSRTIPEWREEFERFQKRPV